MILKYLIKYAIILALLCGAYLVTVNTHTYYHEKAHESIFTWYGCNETQMDVRLMSGRTTCQVAMTPQAINNMYQMQVTNEIYGYNTRTFIELAFVLALLAILHFAISDISKYGEKQ